MEIVLPIVFLFLVLGYGFAEIGRYIAINRKTDSHLFPYPAARLFRRLSMAALLMLSLITLVLFVRFAPFSSVLFRVLILLLFAAFIMVAVMDMRDTMKAYRDSRTNLKRELTSQLEQIVQQNKQKQQHGKKSPDERQK